MHLVHAIISDSYVTKHYGHYSCIDIIDRSSWNKECIIGAADTVAMFCCCTLYVSSCFFKGIKFLIEKGLLNDTAEDIALFLYAGELLDKKAIGDYLGEG